uniref:CCHC-type domain-containing protein n=1 Tax=Tanacetum cinerariifolium TaxID=118510 RepID=A0A699HYL4_TANCI|nr:hypothetical protein [Tanacetum cinerariifolium]
MTIAGAKETVGGQVVQQSGIQCFNCKEFGHFAKKCKKPKRVKDSTYHKEKMLMCKQAEKGVQLQAEKSYWLANIDKEIDKQELEAHYNYMAKIQEVPTADSGTDSEPLEHVQYNTGYNVFANEIQHSMQSESISNTCVVETGDSNVILDSPYICDNNIQNDQNTVECGDERVALANLIGNITLDVDENKKIQKQLEKGNATLAQELTDFCKEKASNIFQNEREQYFEIQDLKAQLQDKNIAISELKKLVEKCKGKLLETKFDKQSVVRQPNAQRIPKLSTQMKDKVVPNNSQVKDKKTEVEEHPRISSISNKTKYVTVCNDSLKSKTSNVNVVCATCGKCLVDSDHFACVTKILNDVNARTKKPNVVPISTRKPKGHAHKSIATPPKKTVASKSTTQKSKSYYRMLYEKSSKAWKWWIGQQCPLGYKRVPKTKTKWKLGSISGIIACREALNKKKTTFTHKVVLYKKMDQDSTYMVAASKVPMLKPGVETTIAPATAEEKAQRRLDLKAKSTLLMVIPNEH